MQGWNLGSPQLSELPRPYFPSKLCFSFPYVRNHSPIPSDGLLYDRNTASLSVQMGHFGHQTVTEKRKIQGRSGDQTQVLKKPIIPLMTKKLKDKISHMNRKPDLCKLKQKLHHYDSGYDNEGQVMKYESD